jgi:NitT/TauT family transport system substrate-binding protein
MSIGRRIVSTLAAIWITVGLVGGPHAEPLRISYFTWIGNGPLFVAEEKGLFVKEGVDVQLINIDDHTAAFAGLFAGQVDAIEGAAQDAPVFYQPDAPLVCVFPLNDSRGGDGILATNDIETIADLEGKSVAFLRGSVGQFFLNVLLEEAGLSEADIEVVDLPAEDGAEAFMLGEVDAAVTWEPYLTRGANVAHGHLLASTAAYPGLLVDCLMAMPQVFEARKDAFRAFARAWAAAVDYAEAYPADANEIMARRLGLEDAWAFARLLAGARLYDGERSRDYFGTPDRPGQIYQTMQQAIDVWSGLGRVQVEITPADVIRHGVWED